MTKEIILSQEQMDVMVNTSKQNSLETQPIYKFNIGNMYELLFIKKENGYYYSVVGDENVLTTKLDDKTYEAYMDIIKNPVI